MPMDFHRFVQVQTRILPAAYAMFLGLNAQAGTAPPSEPRGVAAAFGNTIKSLYPDGKAQFIWLKADGAWEGINRRGKSSSGKWTQKAEKVCLKQTKPFSLPISYCTRFPEDGGLGAVWASKDVTGQPIQLTLVKGIERP